MEIQELGEDIIDFFKQRVTELMLPLEVKWLYQACPNQKQLIKLSKINDQYKFATGCDILVQVNPEYYDKFDAEDTKIIEILFDQEIDNITFNMEKGTFKVGKPTFKSNVGIINKYTYDEVARAVETERLLTSQNADKEREAKDQAAEEKKAKRQYNKRK